MRISSKKRALPFTATLLAAAMLFSPMAHAELKIGVVNIARLLDESPQARNAMGALQKEFEPRRQEILSAQESLQTREAKLQRDAQIMGDEQRRSTEREVRELQRDLQRRQNEYLEDLNIRRNEELGRLQRSLMEEVQGFAAGKNYDLIMGDGVLYASTAVDITADVLKGLEASYTTGK